MSGPTTTKDLLNFHAFSYAQQKHGDTKDDMGQNYFLAHVCQVVAILKCITNDPEIIAAGYLHDVIEDTGTSYEEIVSTFGKRVADLVMEVTHEGNKQDGYYFPRLKSRDAILIKLADRLSNVSRMEAWAFERQEHYLKKTRFWKTSKGDKSR